MNEWQHPRMNLKRAKLSNQILNRDDSEKSQLKQTKAKAAEVLAKKCSFSKNIKIH